jgi:hypothetical protein
MRLEAVWQLARARLRLALRPVGTILAELGGGPVVMTPATGAVEAGLGRAVASAAARVPWRSDCLLQAMAASAMLANRSISSHVCIGVRRTPAGTMEAHAWLVANGGIVTGLLPDLAEFSEIRVEKLAGFNARFHL